MLTARLCLLSVRLVCPVFRVTFPFSRLQFHQGYFYLHRVAREAFSKVFLVGFMNLRPYILDGWNSSGAQTLNPKP